MLRRLICGLVAVLSTMLVLIDNAPASSIDLPPPPLRDKGYRTSKSARSYEVRGLVDGQPIDLVCNIRFIDPYFGYLSQTEYGLQHKAAVSVRCYHATPKLFTGAPVRFDESKKQWIKSVENAVPFRGPDFTPEEVKTLDRAIRVYNVEAINAKGYAFTEDELMGEESGRSRVLHYCLVHDQKALCGQGDMGYVQDIRRHPRNDLTNYTLRILRSIEFIDEPAAATPSAPAASAAASSP